MKTLVRAIAFTLAALAACIAQAQLSETEQRIVAAVKERTAASLQLLERAVRVNSGTLNVEGVREVGRIFQAELDALGFATRWAEMPPQMKRAGHLIAIREGTQGNRLLLLGHLDTVFEMERPVSAWEPRGTRVRGQGVSDMKGGDVIVIQALQALQTVGALDNTTISVIFTGDEERTGTPLERSRADLVELAKRSDAALSFEGSAKRGPNHTASIARRSASSWAVTVKARQGHSAGVFSNEFGFGAIYEGARILNAFREQLIEPNLTFNAGVALGGTDVTFSTANAAGTAAGKGNVIARDFVVRGDLRFLTPEQGERVKRRMREIVQASLPGASATITFRDAYPPMPATDAALRLLETYSKASADAGLGPIDPLDPGERGAGDVQFAAPHVPGIDGLGASGSGAHTDDENLEIASIERGAIRAAILIYRLTRP
ncbi:MAG: M20/M25/M40 family metallo-hydrolase [Usitatibacter sp.]